MSELLGFYVTLAVLQSRLILVCADLLQYINSTAATIIASNITTIGTTIAAVLLPTSFRDSGSGCVSSFGLILSFSEKHLYILSCTCRFPVWCLGQGVEFVCIGSWSLPFYLLYIEQVASMVITLIDDIPIFHETTILLNNACFRFVE